MSYLSLSVNLLAGVLLTTTQNPTSFDNFSSSGKQQLAVPFFQQQGEGKFCFPINIGSSGISGVQDGANVTIQILFDGGDGNLFQASNIFSTPYLANYEPL